MPGLINELLLQTGKVQFDAAAASEKPREAEGSYMPCFLVGVSHAKAVAFTMGVPYFGSLISKAIWQQGAWSAGRMDLLTARS